MTEYKIWESPRQDEAQIHSQGKANKNKNIMERSTVEPRFTNLIRSWRPFVSRNVHEPKLILSHGVLFNNI
jgi:hypothetical protein